MSRKPLVNLNEINSTYSSNPTYNMLLSGNMVPVKRRVIDAALSKRNVPVLVINLDRTSPYISSCNYDYSINDSSTGYDMFSAMNIRDACIYLQNAAFEKSYCDEQTVQIIKYLRLIERLNRYLGLTLPTIKDINAYYYNNKKIENIFNDDILIHDIINKRFYVYKCQVDRIQLRILYTVIDESMIIISHYCKKAPTKEYINYFEKVSSAFIFESE